MATARTARILRIAAYTLATLVVVVGLVFGGAAVALARGWLTPFLERQMSAALRAPVRIEGQPSLLFELPPGLRITGIAVGERGEAARIGRVEGTIRILPLLAGEVRLGRLEIEAGRIDRVALAAARTGGAPQAEARTREADQAQSSGDLPRIDRLHLADIVYFDGEPGFGGPLSIAIARVDGAVGRGNAVEFDGEGRMQRAPGSPTGLPLPPPAPDTPDAERTVRIENGFDLPWSLRFRPAEGRPDTFEGGLRLGDDRVDVEAVREGNRVRTASLQGQGSILGQVLGSFGFLGRPIGDWQLNARVDRGAPGGRAALALDGNFDGTTIRFNGGGDPEAPLQRFDGRVEVSGDDPSDLLETLGRAPVSLPPYSITAHLTRENQRIRIDDLAGRIGDSDIGGVVDIDLSGSPVPSVARLSSRRLDLDDLGPLIGLPGGSADDETLSPRQREEARVYRASPRVLPELPFRADLWRRLDLDVSYRAAEVNAPNLPIRTLDFRVVVRGGKLEVEPLVANIADGTLGLHVAIDGTTQRPQARITLDARDLRIERFLSAAGAGPVALGRLGARIELAGEGEGLRALASDAEGRIGVSLTGGAVEQRLVELAGLDIGEFLVLALGDDNNKRIPIRCVVADLAVENGSARTRALLFDTPDSKVAGQGRIDLGSESMNLMFRVFPRDFSFLSANMPIRVTGSLKSPTVEPAGFGAEDRVLGWLLAPADAVLAFIAPGYPDDHPCAAALARAPKAQATPAPPSDSAPPPRPR